MKFCGVVGCSHRSNRDIDFKFFRFPSIQTRQRKILPARVERRASWIAALHREDFTETKAKNYFVCSAHFITGRPSDDPEHPDYVPSQNMGYKTKLLKRFKKQKRFLKSNAVPSKELPTNCFPIASACEETSATTEREQRRSKKNSAAKQNPLSSVVEKTIQDKQEIVNRSNAVHKTTDQGDNKDQDDPSPKKKLRSAPKADSNDDFDPLDLNNLLLSTTSVLKGMCKELKESTVMNKHVDYSNLDKERITLTTSGGDDEQSLQIVIVNKDPRDTTPSITEATDDLERMLTDVENVVTVEKKCAKETKTISTQTENTFLEVENKKLKLEIASLKSKILSLQNQIQQQDAPKLLFVCNDD